MDILVFLLLLRHFVDPLNLIWNIDIWQAQIQIRSP